MKQKGLLITAIVLLSVVIILLAGFLAVVLSGTVALSGVGNFVHVSSEAETLLLDDYDAADISDVSVTCGAADVSFEKSADEKIHIAVYGDPNDKVNVSLKDKTLVLEMTRKNFFINFDRTARTILVSLPETFSGTISVDDDYGDVRVADFPAASLNVDSDAGDVKSGAVKNAVINCDYGDVDLSEVSENCTVDADAGSVNVGKVKNLAADCDYGEITAGEITGKCSIENNCGDVLISVLSVTEDSYIACDYGSVKIDKAENVFIDAECKLGEVSIRENDRKADVTLKITNNCGDITVG